MIEGGEERQRWYFTFGSNHLPGLNLYVVMTDMTFSEARALMHELAGPKWCGQYSGEQWLTNEYRRHMRQFREFSRLDLPGHLRYSDHIHPPEELNHE